MTVVYLQCMPTPQSLQWVTCSTSRDKPHNNVSGLPAVGTNPSTMSVGSLQYQQGQTPPQCQWAPCSGDQPLRNISGLPAEGGQPLHNVSGLPAVGTNPSTTPLKRQWAPCSGDQSLHNVSGLPAVGTNPSTTSVGPLQQGQTPPQCQWVTCNRGKILINVRELSASVNTVSGLFAMGAKSLMVLAGCHKKSNSLTNSRALSACKMGNSLNVQNGQQPKCAKWATA